jgi:enoyl-[acyl-carrier-protein] reductase (NADH)
MAAAAAEAPAHHLVDIDDVGALAAFLVSDGARRLTGTIIPVGTRKGASRRSSSGLAMMMR